MLAIGIIGLTNKKMTIRARGNLLIEFGHRTCTKILQRLTRQCDRIKVSVCRARSRIIRQQVFKMKGQTRKPSYPTVGLKRCTDPLLANVVHNFKAVSKRIR